ncbi:MAG: BTAD domain-containing putative transcriptional regulator [Anaerolineales bacterium]|nr:MAG: BTAD domain-containing putative transcriptional regulator [Anaerolineales bacterium]
MKSSPLLNTKFIAPPVGDRLPRPHLIQWLENQSERRLILVSAPPGYGKTTLLSDFLHGLSRPAAWYQLEASDSDPAVFLTYLIEAIRRARPKKGSRFGQNAQSLLNSASTGIEPQRALIVLINELAEQVDDPLLIVLEDYHYIASPVVHQLLDYLLENAPSSLRLIVSTRTEPPLALARLRARGLLAELRASDLRFSDEEVAALLQREIPDLTSESLSLLSEKTEGWAAALQIVRNSLAGQNASAASEIITGLSGSHRYVFEYLAEEVFRRQPKDVQDFLLKTSILRQMDAASCKAVAEAAGAQEILEELEDQNLFLTSLDSERRWYRYHFLFREFLLSRLNRENNEQVSDLEKSAGRYYEEQNEWEAAFGHYASASDFESAARVALNFASDYVERGRIEVLHRYLNMLPTEVLRAHPELLLQHGNTHRRLGEAGLAVTAYEDALNAFTAQGNASGKSRALTRLAEVHRAQGNYRQAESLAAQALEAAPKKDHTARAEALMAFAKSTGFLSGMDRGQELAEQAVDEARKADGLSPLERAGFLLSLGQICWWHGDPLAAAQYAEEALRLAPDELSPITAQACILLVTLHLYWREFEKALQYAERGLEISQTLHLNELLPAAYTALGNVLTRLGETARAEAALRQSVELAQRLGMASYEKLMATGYLAYNLYSQGRVDEAWQLAEGALWAYTGNPDAYEAFVCRSVLADVALENSQLNRAEDMFNGLLQLGKRRQFQVPLAMVYFGLSYIHLMTDRKETGLQHACAALKLIEPTRALQLFIDQGERCRVVCNALIESGRSGPFLERVLEGLPDKRRKPTITVKDQSVITVKSMGVFRVFAGGEEITQERWVSSKARDLLAYFVTFRGERVPADRAFDAIWAEKAGRGLTAFHTALSRLRNALRTGENPPRLILVEAGDYRLDAARFKIDVDEFDAALAKARVTARDDEAAHLYEQAVNFYRGEYLQNQYYDWLFPERRRLTQAYLGALRTLADFHYSHERYTRALELLERALRVDSLQEEVYCQSMRVLAALGDRAGLAQQYQEMKKTLARELDMEPLPATESLYQKLMGKFKN